jgi:agmatinase
MSEQPLFLSATQARIGDELPDDASAILGVPYDGAVTYRGGASGGPEGTRLASDSIETYCPRLDADIEDGPVFDLGDLEIPSDPKDGKDLVDRLRAQIDPLPDAATLKLIGIGGDHLMAYPFLTRALDRYPNLDVFHIDAHTDLRTDWEGEPFNHSTVIGRMLDYMGPEGRLFSWGIRSGLRSEFAQAKADPRVTYIENTAEAGLACVRRILQEGRPVYLTLDVDGIDPADIPGTGTPEPAGLRYGDVERALGVLFAAGRDRWAGADIVELAPALDPTGRSSVAVARLVRTLLLCLQAR